LVYNREWSLQERLEKNIITVQDTGCWEWQAYKNEAGYAIMSLNNKTTRVHRIAYELYNESKIPNGLIVCHSCDNPCCINPEHLWLGTHADNVNDKVNKGRAMGGSNKGEINPQRILNEYEVLEIREKYSTGNYTQEELGTEYSVSRSAIKMVVNRNNWKHI